MNTYIKPDAIQSNRKWNKTLLYSWILCVWFFFSLYSLNKYERNVEKVHLAWEKLFCDDIKQGKSIRKSSFHVNVNYKVFLAVAFNLKFNSFLKHDTIHKKFFLFFVPNSTTRVSFVSQHLSLPIYRFPLRRNEISLSISHFMQNNHQLLLVPFHSPPFDKRHIKHTRNCESKFSTA